MAQREQDPIDIYHETQIRELCALHTLNNLFQGLFISVKLIKFYQFEHIDYTLYDNI